MISLETYKLVHLISIVLVFSGLMGMLAVRMSEGKLEGQVKKLFYASHGLGLLLILISGFGLLARLGLTHDIPKWVMGKLLIWLILGGITALIKRKGYIGWPIFALLVALFSLAAYLALFKPF